MKIHPPVNIIHDSRMVDRYEPLIAELERQHIENYEIWPCILMPDVVHSINSSHKMIVKDAKEKGLPEICIMEDDVMFPNEKGWEYFLSNKPPVYEIYSAGNYMAFQRPPKHGAMRVDEIVGFHCYMVHSSYYDIFLKTPVDQHIDTAQKGKLMYVAYPFPALQRAGFSSNNKAVCNYNAVLKQEDIYK